MCSQGSAAPRLSGVRGLGVPITPVWHTHGAIPCNFPGSLLGASCSYRLLVFQVYRFTQAAGRKGWRARSADGHPYSVRGSWFLLPGGHIRFIPFQGS